VSDAHEEKIERSALLLELDDEFRDSNLPMIERFFQVLFPRKPTLSLTGGAATPPPGSARWVRLMLANHNNHGVHGGTIGATVRLVACATPHA
jgi:hypothetical protein